MSLVMVFILFLFKFSGGFPCQDGEVGCVVSALAASCLALIVVRFGFHFVCFIVVDGQVGDVLIINL